MHFWCILWYQALCVGHTSLSTSLMILIMRFVYEDPRRYPQEAILKLGIRSIDYSNFVRTVCIQVQRVVRHFPSTALTAREFVRTYALPFVGTTSTCSRCAVTQLTWQEVPTGIWYTLHLQIKGGGCRRVFISFLLEPKHPVEFMLRTALPSGGCGIWRFDQERAATYGNAVRVAKPTLPSGMQLVTHESMKLLAWRNESSTGRQIESFHLAMPVETECIESPSSIRFPFVGEVVICPLLFGALVQFVVVV